MIVDHFVKLLCVSLLVSFADTVDQVEITLPCLFYFIIDNLLIFIEQSSSFTVTDENTFDPVIGKVVS